MITFSSVDFENTGGGVMTYWGQVSKKRSGILKQFNERKINYGRKR